MAKETIPHDPAAAWKNDVEVIKTTDALLGGVAGPINYAARDLASRTSYLKKLHDTDIAYLSANKLDKTSFTPAQLLAMLLAIDGAGSGLDADKVRGLPADFSSLLSPTGYQKLPSGLIIQWVKGVYTANFGTNSATGVVAQFPLAFPNDAFVAIPIENSGGVHSVAMSVENKQSVRIWARDHTGAYPGNTIFSYVALGY